MNTISIAAPKGYHWMQYEDGPALMVGEDPQHEGASESVSFEVIEEHDPERLSDESIEKESFKPPKGVQEQAALGLKMRREHNRGGTEVGVARARNLSNGDNIPMETINRMVSYFARHGDDLKSPSNSKPGADGYPGAGLIAWKLWGGDAGELWANSIAERQKIKKASNEYLRQALDLAKKQLPGWAWAVIHQTARGRAGGKARGAGLIKCDDLPLRKQAVDESLNKSRVVFVVSEPNQLEKARDKLLVGADGVTFDSVYLKALGLVRADVSVCTVEDFLRAEITAPAVALGKLAKAALGDKVIASMPHPTAIRKLGDSGEVERKAKAIKKVLTIPAMSTNTTTKPTEPSGEFTVEITKASSDELRIVYGVVLDPYVEDAHGDIVPPKEVERTAHNWMAKSRIIGLQHSGMADAEPVESWLVPYPTDKDYQAAMRGEAHSAMKSPFGTDVVHSGTWIIGTKLGPKEWQAVKDGELNAYSIGGFGKRNKVEQSALPTVNFIEGNLDG